MRDRVRASSMALATALRVRDLPQLLRHLGGTRATSWLVRDHAAHQGVHARHTAWSRLFEQLVRRHKVKGRSESAIWYRGQKASIAIAQETVKERDT